jgi:hypothetical protein
MNGNSRSQAVHFEAAIFDMNGVVMLTASKPDPH